jgi:hypothetical protein
MSPWSRLSDGCVNGYRCVFLRAKIQEIRASQNRAPGYSVNSLAVLSNLRPVRACDREGAAASAVGSRWPTGTGLECPP